MRGHGSQTRASSGEKWKWWHWLGLDLLTGGAVSMTVVTTAATAIGTAGLVATALPIIQTTVSSIDFGIIFFGTLFNGDPAWGGKRFDNWLKLELQPFNSLAGLFDYDKSANWYEWPMQVINNFGGEFLQDQIGTTFAHLQNIGGNIDEIGYYKGRAIIRLNDGYIGNDMFLGISFGHYVFGHNIALNPNDNSQGTKGLDLFAHEFGHTYQSRISGPLYLFKYGIPSAAGGSKSEYDANKRAHKNGLPIGSWRSQESNRYNWWEDGLSPLLWPFMWIWNR